jgi:hypothetical protein
MKGRGLAEIAQFPRGPALLEQQAPAYEAIAEWRLRTETFSICDGGVCDNLRDGPSAETSLVVS